MTKYVATDKEGKSYQIEDLSRFCEDFNISYNAMVRVANGHAKSHQDWKIEHVDEQLRENARKNLESLKISTTRKEKDDVIIMINNDTGEIVEVSILTEFCEEKGLNKGAISLVTKGIRKSHKGWMVKK